MRVQRVDQTRLVISQTPKALVLDLLNDDELSAGTENRYKFQEDCLGRGVTWY